MNKILAVGDCITLGVGECLGNSYPEKVGRPFDAPVTNRGYTMSTSREGLSLLNDSLTDEHDMVFLQFGLADSYFTFKYSPYVLYYPDNFLRKQVRSIVKKYKKSCRKLGMHDRYGVKTVVPQDEYRANFQRMIDNCSPRLVILPETLPHLETYRNESIKEYNRILRSLADENGNCHLIPLFDGFLPHLSDYYLDNTHPNDAGYEYIANEILTYIQDHELVRTAGEFQPLTLS